MEYFTISQAASIIGIARRSLYVSWIHKGRVRVERLAGKPMISVREIERLKTIRAAKKQGPVTNNG